MFDAFRPTKARIILTVSLALLGAAGFWLFSRGALAALDQGMGFSAPIGFLLFAVFGWPMLLGLRFEASTVALVEIGVLNIAYLYALSSIMVVIARKLRR